MADVLLGQAYYLRFDPKLWRAQQPYAPLGTLYAASHLREAGHSVAFFDAMLASDERAWAAALDASRPRFAVIYEDSFNYLTKMCLLRMRQAAQTMITLARSRGCEVIVSGSDATDRPELYLHAGASAVVLGEGEVTLSALVGVLKAGGSPRDVAGVAMLNDDGRVVRSAPRPFVRALDDLPLPAWDLVDVRRYQAIWRRRHGYHAMNVATTRGCPFHCNWCAKPIYGQRYAVRSAASVVEEIAWLQREYHPDQVTVVDDVFGLQPGWVSAFAACLQEAGVRMPFRCLMRADQINAEIVRALVAAGCRMVWMGAESGSQRILDAMEKGVRVAQIREAARMLQDGGIDVGLFLQFGYPGEEWDDVEATLQLVRDVSPHDIGVSVSYPLPGTKFYERVRAELGRKQNWFDSDDLAMMYRATYEPEFYRVLHHVVHREFRTHRIEHRMRSLRVQPSTARLSDVRRVAAWVYNRAALAAAQRDLRRLARRDRALPVPGRMLPVLTQSAASVPSQQEEGCASL
jgi:anaerobic magnesium-protoporphyrin IX monomethyl ester cyclase